MFTNSISVLINSVSFFSCILVFAIYPQTKQKSIGFKMILVLCISDFLLAAMNLFRFLFFMDQFACYSLSTLNYLIANFSLIWSTTIAFVSYLSIKSQITCSSKQVFWTSLITSSLIASILTLMFSTEIMYSIQIVLEDQSLMCTSTSPLISPADDLIKFYSLEILTKIFMILVTFICYAKVNRKLQEQQQTANKAKVSRMKWYPICQIILYGPILINEIAKVGFARHDVEIDQVVIWIFQLAGAINSTTYILQRTEFKKLFFKKNKKSFDHSFLKLDSHYLTVPIYPKKNSTL